jgi:hypothetical protein
MTNRIPLIVNSSTAQLQELPSGDALDLANSSIVNANAIAANSLAISGNTTVTGNISSGNVLATGYFFANGDPFTSSSGGGASGGTAITMSLIFGR